MADLVAAHADWSTIPAKRWVTIAQRSRGAWMVQAPRPVDDPAALAAALTAPGVPAALGLDLPLGLPRAYAATRTEADFPAFLRARAGDAAFFAVSESLATVLPTRPFYPARGIKGMTRAAHAAALGLASAADISRWCDRATATRPAGAPLFWTLGANQSGKAAISAWRDWLAPALASGAPLRLWPFQGALHALLAPGTLAIAEVYPAEALRHCGITLKGSKRVQAVRQAATAALRAAMADRNARPDPAMAAMIADGFGRDAAGEDRFDSAIGLLGLIGVLDGKRPDVIPDDPWIRRWEGWVLGQVDLPQQVLR